MCELQYHVLVVVVVTANEKKRITKTTLRRQQRLRCCSVCARFKTIYKTAVSVRQQRALSALFGQKIQTEPNVVLNVGRQQESVRARQAHTAPARGRESVGSESEKRERARVRARVRA